MLILACITLLASAFFSGVEIAFISSNKLKLELDKNTGKFPANIIAYFSKNESHFITTMLVGNNAALVVYGIAMSQLITESISILIDSDIMLLLIQTLICTAIVLVTAEFMPKAIFRIYPNQILKVFSIPILVFFIIFKPLVVTFLNMSNFILKYFFRQENKEGRQVFGKPDLDEYLNKIKSVEGIKDSGIEVEMLQNVLELTDKKLRECMIPRTELVAINIKEDINVLKNKFIETKLSKILIYKQDIDKIIGYVHSSDLFKSPKNIKTILLPILFVPESMLVTELLNQFIENDKGIAVVVDEFGGTSGIITIEDLTEEIVGEIVDEHDTEEIQHKKLSENKYYMLGRIDVDLINKVYELELPELDEYETIAGLLLHHLEDIPKKGDKIKLKNYEFTIQKVNQTQIQEVDLEVYKTIIE